MMLLLTMCVGAHYILSCIAIMRATQSAGPSPNDDDGDPRESSETLTTCAALCRNGVRTQRSFQDTLVIQMTAGVSLTPMLGPNNDTKRWLAHMDGAQAGSEGGREHASSK